MADGGVEIECGCLAGCVDCAVQLYRAVFIIQCHVSVESALFVFSVQRDVFIGVIAVIYGSNQSLHGNGRIPFFVMISFEVHVEGYFPEFVVIQQLAQFELCGLYCTGIGKITFFFVRTELEVRLDSAYVRTHFTIGDQICEVSGYFSPERYRT